MIAGSSNPDSIYDIVKDKLHALLTIVTSADDTLRPKVLNELRNASVPSILSGTYDQLLSVLDAHNVDNNAHVVNFATELIKLGNAVNVAKTCFAPNSRLVC